MTNILQSSFDFNPQHRSVKSTKTFWQKVDRSGGPDACWPWMGGRNRDGYGRSRAVSGIRLTHRSAYFLTYGPIPDGMGVLHTCDNPPCCNPAHLFLGTQADNNRDRHAKNRTRIYHMHGEQHGQARLTEAQVREIRRRNALGETPYSLAKTYPVARSTIRSVILYKTWKHI